MKGVFHIVASLLLATILLLISLPVNAQGVKTIELEGCVRSEGKGIPSVVVTDGLNCVVTDKDGNYKINSLESSKFVYITVPAGYLVDNKENKIPQFFQLIEKGKTNYNFNLNKNKRDDNRHVFVVQADVQATSSEDLNQYESIINDMAATLKTKRNYDAFGVDCGDMVGDCPHLFPEYIEKMRSLNIPFYRAIGNHDMTYGGRTFEYSYSTVENYFGPTNYSFNKGKAHYIILDNCFYVNRDYQYIGYIPEKTLAWMEQDLANVPKTSIVFVVMHIPTSLSPKLKWNVLQQDETSNAAGLYDLLKGYNTHIISGHTHFNLNVSFNDSLMEHNTAAACGTWWQVPECLDGTPRGYAVYDVSGDKVTWYYKSAGYDRYYQMRVYGLGEDKDNPDYVVANVWNYDDKWKVELLEDGKKTCDMDKFTGYDPLARVLCADKNKVKYDWISPIPNEHMFKAKPKDRTAKLQVRVYDRFGNKYVQDIE